ncbi:QueT transporter family protein [Lentibacillus jeotgali]|uniref:QueT transporter family protein n=1 Tax=Lentibacillus jeotgali TaxID=558169 RepID=UPI003CCA8951
MIVLTVRTLAVNAILAVAYVVLSLATAPLAFSTIQFRIPEMLNHLVIFNTKYFYGIVLGVFLINLIPPTGMYDLAFGVAHTVLSLAFVMFLATFIKHKLILMVINTIVFTLTMFIIAYQLIMAADLPFLQTWLTSAAGEFIVMALGIPIMYMLNKRWNFNELMERH